MFSKELKKWKRECEDEKELESYREDKDNPEAQFFAADALLSEAERGKSTADAVWLMESSAKAGFVQAMIAMGEMFQYGWAVRKSIPKAIEWYEKAAKAGSEDAAARVDELKRKKRIMTGAIASSAAVAAVIVLVAALIVSSGIFATGVLVNKSTELKKSETAEEFGKTVQTLMEKYDDTSVVLGKSPTNRLVLRFEGDKLDLSDFNADAVIWKADNMVVIQFSDEAEAQRCLEILKNTPGVIYVEEDRYENTIDYITTKATTVDQTYEQQWSSQYSDNTYYSWGITSMEMDRLNAYLVDSGNKNSVTVAVIDSGVEPNSETEDRILPGVDFTGLGEDGREALCGHGTHVAGVILNASQGLDVKILPIRVSKYDGSNTLTIGNAFAYAVEQGADVINYSMGGPHSEIKDDAITKALEAGVTVVVAAGNEAVDTATYCPAHMENCIVVAANTVTDETASFSNYGESVTVSAPGYDILSYHCDDSNLEEEFERLGMTEDMEDYCKEAGYSSIADLKMGVRLDNGIYVAFMNGTSMATPHITALAALMKLIDPDATPDEIKGYIEDYCVDMGDELHYGAGVCRVGGLAGD